MRLKNSITFGGLLVALFISISGYAQSNEALITGDIREIVTFHDTKVLEIVLCSDTLMVLGGSGDPGTIDNRVPIDLVNKVAVSKIQFDLIDEPNFLTATAADITPRTSGFLVTVTQAGGVVLYNESGLTIAPGQGVILEILYDVDPNTNVPEVPLYLRNVVVFDANNQPIPSVIAVDSVFIIPNPIPVELTSFSVQAVKNQVEIHWSTATETNNYGFEIERSQDSSDFHKIGFVKGHGTTTTPHVYHYTDLDVAPETYYYRLKQIDTGGSFDYSDIKIVTVGLPGEYSLSQNYPNPFNPETTIEYQLPQESWVTLRIFDFLGREVRTLLNGKKKAGVHKIQWNSRDNDGKKVASGIYLYHITVRPGFGQKESFMDIKKLMLLR